MTIALSTTTASADGRGGKADMTVARSFKLDDMGVTTLLDGTVLRDGAKDIFGGGASDEDC